MSSVVACAHLWACLMIASRLLAIPVPPVHDYDRPPLPQGLPVLFRLLVCPSSFPSLPSCIDRAF